MQLRRALALVGAVTAAAFAACKELPFAPRWDADMYMPLTTQPIALSNFVQPSPLNIIPNGVSVPDSFPPQQEDVTGAVGDVLKNLVTDFARARTVLTISVSKTTPTQLSATDTLFVASHSSALHPTALDTTIVFPISLAATDPSKTDSITLSLAQINMLRATIVSQCNSCAAPSRQIWTQVRGRVSNNSGSTIVITAADSMTTKLTTTARIAVVHK